MYQCPDYNKSADADNIRIFHGREVRQVPDAAGGMGMVLQLSYAGEEDKQGWTPKEIEIYDGWGSDRGRTWNLARESDEFRKAFGENTVSLQHRFYLHLDGQNKLWLSAEDGCEGTPTDAPGNPLQALFGKLF